MTIEFQPVRVNTGSPDEEGRLVFVAGRLVAVLVRLSDQHEDASGQWYLEHGFGVLNDPASSTFPSLQVVETWIEHRLATADAGRPARAAWSE